MTLEELKALAGDYYGVDGYVWHEDVVMRLFEENARLQRSSSKLRELLRGKTGIEFIGGHPAFTPDGEVK